MRRQSRNTRSRGVRARAAERARSTRRCPALGPPGSALATGPHPVIAPLAAVAYPRAPDLRVRACALAKLVEAELHDLNERREGRIDLEEWFGLSVLEGDAHCLTKLLAELFPEVELPPPAPAAELSAGVRS